MPRKLKQSLQLLRIKEEGEILANTPSFRYNCTICKKSYKTKNQISSHLLTKKHYNQVIHHNCNNKTLKPSLLIEGNPFVQQLDIYQPKQKQYNYQQYSHQCFVCTQSYQNMDLFCIHLFEEHNFIIPCLVLLHHIFFNYTNNIMLFV